jgi:hypothetical protein
MTRRVAPSRQRSAGVDDPGAIHAAFLEFLPGTAGARCVATNLGPVDRFKLAGDCLGFGKPAIHGIEVGLVAWTGEDIDKAAVGALREARILQLGEELWFYGKRLCHWVPFRVAETQASLGRRVSKPPLARVLFTPSRLESSIIGRGVCGKYSRKGRLVVRPPQGYGRGCLKGAS